MCVYIHRLCMKALQRSRGLLIKKGAARRIRLQRTLLLLFIISYFVFFCLIISHGWRRCSPLYTFLILHSTTCLYTFYALYYICFLTYSSLLFYSFDTVGELNDMIKEKKEIFYISAWRRICINSFLNKK